MIDRFGREWVSLPPPVDQVLDERRACRHGEPRGERSCALCRAAKRRQAEKAQAAASNQLMLPVRHLSVVRDV